MDDQVAHRPSPALATAIRRFVGYQFEGLDPGEHVGLPSTKLTLVLPVRDKLDVTLGGQRGQYDATISGLHLGPATIHYNTTQVGVELSIDPLASRRLLGVPAGELAGTVLELDSVWGALTGQLLDAIHSTSTSVERCAAVERLLHTIDTPDVRREVANAWQLIVRSGGLLTIEAIADAVGWSRRHLELQFRRELGVSPKQACRLRRFERAVGLVRDNHDLAEAAAIAGFADQPHLYRDWRELTGTTPKRWLLDDGLAFVQDGARSLVNSGSHD